jgi:predicted dehydrogenase/threonine dehydrogenase-like Zn-dependent dehydrogenase
MRQVLQSLSDGLTYVTDVPAPVAPRGGLLIRTTRSLISAGTERMLMEFGRAGWVEKARQQPERVRAVLEKASTDGILVTLEAVRSKLDQPVALGYSNVGTVVAVGADVNGYAEGDRVVSNGPHAEWVSAPRNLCARIPDAVSDDEAAFTVLGAVALQGVRLAAPTLGESFAVIGLGLIGLLTVQLLRANGCRVLGIDPNQARRALAVNFGADVVALDRGEEVLAVAASFSHEQGIDGVLITAATKSNEPIAQSARMCRKRGRIVLVGVVGLELDRADFYEKELSFQVSCSYGPGRYDPQYEEKGTDYPLGFVRWTEQRNFQAILEMMASGQLNVKPLISHRFPLDAAAAAYELLATASEPYMGLLLDYPQHAPQRTAVRTLEYSSGTHHSKPGAAPSIAFIGAGNYAGRVLIPAFASSGANLQAIASQRGVTAAHYARKFHFSRASTDVEALFAADDVAAVVIATRHDSHAQFVVQALQSGKHVFVEKPLALRDEEVDAIVSAWEAARAGVAAPQLVVGFNRRFAPHVVRMHSLLTGMRAPKNLIATVNAGTIAADHWTRDRQVGGGRLLGEACHFVDLFRFLTGERITQASVQALGRNGSPDRDDSAVITLRFADGSMGSIYYLANGHRRFPKERIEVFCDGKVLQLDNYLLLRGYGWRGFKAMRLWRQDKGQRALVQAFVKAIRYGGDSPIPFSELIEVSRTMIALAGPSRVEAAAGGNG